jgi:hypothetical protein
LDEKRGWTDGRTVFIQFCFFVEIVRMGLLLHIVLDGVSISLEFSGWQNSGGISQNQYAICLALLKKLDKAIAVTCRGGP